MNKVLLIITTTNDPLNELVISNEESLPNHQVKVIDLTSGEPDYPALLEEIFSSDSVQVW
jgi:hypothetical protein